jgi:hypothetical protein
MIKIQFLGIFSPPQTPTSTRHHPKPKVDQPTRPETPPSSTHCLETPLPTSPETPTPGPRFPSTTTPTTSQSLFPDQTFASPPLPIVPVNQPPFELPTSSTLSEGETLASAHCTKTSDENLVIAAIGGDEFEERIGSPPSTPVLYNLIRNEGPPRFMMQRATVEKEDVEERDLVVTQGNSRSRPTLGHYQAKVLMWVETTEVTEDDMLRGHPSACLFVASLNSAKTEDELRQSVTQLFSQVSQTSAFQPASYISD